MLYFFLITLELAALICAKLNKSPLSSSLDYLHKDLVAYLPSIPASYSKWNPGWIPHECQDVVNLKKLSETDFEVYEVNYDDCDYPWILCRHKASLNRLDDIINYFGRVPVHSRQWVGHVFDWPDHSTTNGYAFNLNGTIAMFNKIDAPLAVLIHETGHSLDLQGAYNNSPLSKSKAFNDAFAKDSNVPDGYAQTNMVENVAQNTMVAMYDLNVPGGLAKVQRNPNAIKNQYSFIQREASDAGNLLMPGGTCTLGLARRQPVWKRKFAIRGGPTKRRAEEAPPDVSLPRGIQEIMPKEFSSEHLCRH